MQSAQTWNDDTAGINRRQAVAIVLVLLAHIVFWQLLRFQNTGLLRYENNSIVHYLQLFNVPKPALVAKPEIKHQAVPPEKNFVQESVTRKRRSVIAQPSGKLLETAPEPITPITAPNPSTEINNDARPAPALDLDALRNSALRMERRRKPTEIEQMQAGNSVKPTLEQRLGEGTKRAEKKDCLKAYSGIGLLAVIPLAVSTVVDTGCKW